MTSRKNRRMDFFLTCDSKRVYRFRMWYIDSFHLFSFSTCVNRDSLRSWGHMAFMQVTRIAGPHPQTSSRSEVRPENLYTWWVARCWCCFGNRYRSLVLKFHCTLEPPGDIKNMCGFHPWGLNLYGVWPGHEDFFKVPQVILIHSKVWESLF